MFELKKVSFSYRDSQSRGISNMSLTIRPGEFLLLCGASGCGKTTVTRLLNGLAPWFYEGELRGEIYLAGQAMEELENMELAGKIGSVFQDPRSQFFTLDTVSELVFPCENRGVSREEMRRRLQNTVAVLRLEGLLGRSLLRLSSGEKQKLAIGSVSMSCPNIYVLDEPSANLDQEATRELAEILGMLKTAGHTVIIAEHRLYYLRELIDRALYLQDGRVEAEYNRAEFAALTEGERLAKGLRSLYPEKEKSVSWEKRPVGQAPFLRMEGVGFSYKLGREVLRQLKLEVCPGEIVAITGQNGAGKSTLAKMLCGLQPETSGKIYFDAQAMNAKKRLRQSYFVMQDADYQLFAESVEAELLLGLPDLPQIRQQAAVILAELGLEEVRQRHPASLSGGQKQRVTIAVALMQEAKVLVFDEPTSGLDARSMRQVAALLRNLAEQGRVVFVITHDYELILQTCTRVIHLQNQRIISDVPLTDEGIKQVRQIFWKEWERAGTGRVGAKDVQFSDERLSNLYGTE